MTTSPHPQYRGNHLIDGIRSHGGTAIAVGVFLVVIGVLSLWSPFITGLSLMAMIGVLLIAGGLAEFAFVFSVKAFSEGLGIVVLSILMVLAGFYMVTRPAAALASVTLILAIYLVVSGIGHLFVAASLRPLRSWGWMALNGIISIFLGILLWRQYPLSGGWAIGTLIGIQLLITGISLIAVGVGVRHELKDVR
jgi:uncharacterized membrane protein HdeD (DUF308 family)